MMKQAIYRVRMAAVSVLVAFVCAGSAWAVDVSTWAEIKSNLEAGENVKLTANIIQDGDTVYMDSVTATLDLNGYTITGTAGAWMFGIGPNKTANLTIVDNSTSKKGALVGPSGGWSAPVDGSCFRVIDGKLTLNGITVKDWNKTASDCNGGAFWVQTSSAKLVINGGVIENCSCKGNGGAIYVDPYDNVSGSVEINGGVIRNCSATGMGGAIFSKRGTVSVNEGGVIEDCVSSGAGGGAIGVVPSDNNYGGTVTIAGGIIRNCSAGGSGSGGAIYCQASTVNMNGGTIAGCTAKGSGGAIFNTAKTYSSKNYGGTVTINDGIVSNCTATANGGAVFCANGGTGRNTGSSCISVGLA